MWNTFDITTLFYWNSINYPATKFNFVEAYLKTSFLLQDKFLNLITELVFTTNMIDAIITALKFLILIAMLIFIRGGIPRYRYDFLTKIGWIKFLSLVLAVFLSSLIFVYVM